MKKLAWYTVLILSTLAALFLMWQFREVFGIFLFSLALGAATRPLVESPGLKRIPRGLALVIVYLALLALVGLLLAGVSNSFLRDLQALGDGFARTYDSIYAQWPHNSGIQAAIAARLPKPNDLYQTLTGDSGTRIAQTLLGLTMNSFTAFTQVFLIIVLSIYWSIDRIHFERLWLSILPVDRRAWARDVWRQVETGVGHYVRNEFVRAILAGLLLGNGLALLGVPAPALLGLFGALLALIPWLGLFLMIFPALVAGLASSPLLGIAAAVYTLAILIALEGFVQPRLFGRLSYSPTLMVLVAIPLADSFGLIGILLAPPLAATLQIIFRSFQQPLPQSLKTSSSEKLDDLRQRLDHVHALASESNGDLGPQTASILTRLDGLLGKADRVLAEEDLNARRRQFLPGFWRNRQGPKS